MGDVLTAAEIQQASANLTKTTTYVWDQRGIVLLEALPAIDFGTCRGSERIHNYKSDDHQFKVTDNRNRRKKKKWRI
ncbi:hypothetical protein [Xylocopilactobacillus apis]|uniref:Uncharacterized protein n=1 Tax=Xylocopilactobacillus apis TaxID=2932183 RepID=A0AAU9DKD0_9LACO|nr:hypothetical protein [Xylocopilactobacillus apis]BDR55939.1 hypothetical protein KIMC2_05010 [Xylocopilactobacillus apis]